MTGPAFENVCEVTVSGWRIRVWFRRESWGDGPFEDQERLGMLVQNVIREIPSDFRPDPMNVAMVIADRLDRVNAIEAKHPSGPGSIFYPEWP